MVNRTYSSIPYVFHNNSAELVLFNATIPIGCRYPQLKWCIYVPQLLIGQYILSLALLAVGYNTAVLSCFTIYSKVLGPFPQVSCACKEYGGMPAQHRQHLTFLFPLPPPPSGYNDGADHSCG